MTRAAAVAGLMAQDTGTDFSCPAGLAVALTDLIAMLVCSRRKD